MKGLKSNRESTKEGKHESERKVNRPTFFVPSLFDAFVRSRHPGENRGPEDLKQTENTGFRLSPE